MEKYVDIIGYRGIVYKNKKIVMIITRRRHTMGTNESNTQVTGMTYAACSRI